MKNSIDYVFEFIQMLSKTMLGELCFLILWVF